MQRVILTSLILSRLHLFLFIPLFNLILPSHRVTFSFGEHKFVICANTLKTTKLEDIYADLGLLSSDEEEEEEPAPKPRDKRMIFPNVETFLWYLFYQQESNRWDSKSFHQALNHHFFLPFCRIFQNKLNLVLLLLNDQRLDHGKFPKSIQGNFLYSILSLFLSRFPLIFPHCFYYQTVLKEIDKELVALSKLKMKEVEVPRVLPKTSKKRKKKQPKEGHPRKAGKRKASMQESQVENGSASEMESTDSDSDCEEECGRKDETPENPQPKTTRHAKVSLVNIESRLQHIFSDPVVRHFSSPLHNLVGSFERSFFFFDFW